MKTYDQIASVLDENIPRDVIAQRDAGGGKRLDYLEAWYVIDRLNSVFGNLGWDFETVFCHEIAGQEKPTYHAQVRIRAMVPTLDGHYINVTREGSGYGRDKSGLNPHEMAIKEAESDALKRAAMKFGRSMGLALYDKSKEYIDEPTKAQPVQPSQTAQATAAVKSAFPGTTTIDERTAVLADITAASAIAIGKGVITREKVIKKLKEDYKANTKEQLTLDQAKKFRDELTSLMTFKLI